MKTMKGGDRWYNHCNTNKKEDKSQIITMKTIIKIIDTFLKERGVCLYDFQHKKYPIKVLVNNNENYPLYK